MAILMLFRANDKNSQNIILLQLAFASMALPVLLLQYQTWYWFAILGWFVFLLHFCHHAGLHRYFSHGSYKLNKFWHIFITFSACLVTFGSPVGYTIAHRTHHRYSDTDLDPHNPEKGKFNTMFFRWNMKGASLLYANGLRDKWIKFTHDWYIAIIGIFYIALLLIDYRLALTYNVGVALAFLAVGYVNVFCHLGHRFTYRNFETPDTSKNDLFAGWVGGEWHNNHHKYPGRFDEKVKWWEFDLAAQFIRLIKKNET
jgi:stearoyl-CoA desaturase (delta-9 desaturase)